MEINDIKNKLNNALDVQDKFYYISILNLLKIKNNINLCKENMIYLKPNFKYLIPKDSINNENYDLAFFYNFKNIKKVNLINSKNFISSNYPYLLIVRDKGVNDNIIIILKTPILKKKLQKGGAIEIDQDLGDHDPNLFPSDPEFDGDKEGNIINNQSAYKNYESGFSKGFDTGYHKGYYFGYTAASAYLYRFYKKYYSDYMNKYQDKIKSQTNQFTDDEKNRMIKESNLLINEIDRLKNEQKELNEQKIKNSNITLNNNPNNTFQNFNPNNTTFQNMSLDNTTFPNMSLDNSTFQNMSPVNTFTNSSQNFNSISPLNMTPQSPTFSSLDSNVTSQSSLSPSNQSISSSTNSLSPINSNNSTIQIGGRKKPYYNFDKLNTLDEYQGLPLYMLPENLFILESLGHRKNGIFKFINNLLNPPKPFENPKLHCYKLDNNLQNKIIRSNIDSRFRNAVVGIEKNWNNKIFKKSCNREMLKFMKYCDDETHPGVKYNTKLKAFTKECKLRKDNKKFNCLIM